MESTFEPQIVNPGMEILSPCAGFCTLLSTAMPSAYYSGQPCSAYILGVKVTPSPASLVWFHLSCVFSSEEMSFLTVLSLH